MNSANFQEEFEEYLVEGIAQKKGGFPVKYNPFQMETISRKIILTTIIYCTVSLASLIYYTNRNNGRKNT